MWFWQYPYEPLRDISLHAEGSVVLERLHLPPGSTIVRVLCQDGFNCASITSSLPRSSYSEITATFAADADPGSNS